MFYSLNPPNETHGGSDKSVGLVVKICFRLMVNVLSVLLVFGPMPHKNTVGVHLVVRNFSEARRIGKVLLESQPHLCDLRRHLT